MMIGLPRALKASLSRAILCSLRESFIPPTIPCGSRLFSKSWNPDSKSGTEFLYGEGPSWQELKPGESFLGKYEHRYKVVVPREKVEVKFTRSSGPGGQHVNTTDSAVQLRIDTSDPDCFIPELVVREIEKKFPQNISSKGTLLVDEQGERHQALNLENAFARLQEIIDSCSVIRIKRRLKKPDPGATERRIREKKIRSMKKAGRRPPNDF